MVSSQSDARQLPQRSKLLETISLSMNLGRMELGYTNIDISTGESPEFDGINAVAMEKLKTLLIANRGEIAVRITKTAK